MYNPTSSLQYCLQPQPPLKAAERGWPCKSTTVELAPSCPRCASSNTKFCYYNNYSFSQPRYLCKSCRRYWTKGGSLRNVPVGGGCRKTRRSKPPRPTSTAAPPQLPPCPPASDIDLAAVFAKFLHDNSGAGNSSMDPIVSVDSVGSGSSDREDLEGETETLTPSGVSREPDQLPDQNQQGELLQIGEELFVGDEDLSLLGMNEELEQDLAWSDAANWPNFQLQDHHLHLHHHQLGTCSSSDDQWKISANICNDGWSWFDLSAHEI